MENKNKFENVWDKTKDISRKTAKTVAGKATDIAEKTKETASALSDKAAAAIEEKHRAAEEELQNCRAQAMLAIEGTRAETFVNALGDSPVKLTEKKIKQIKSAFPIPREQNIIWADAEFDLRPSGVAVTGKGVFIRTNVSLLDGKINKVKIDGTKLLNLTDEEIRELRHQARYHSGKASLFYYAWDDFEASWFTSEAETENTALLVDPKCSERFINVCRTCCAETENKPSEVVNAKDFDNDDRNSDSIIEKAGIIAGAAVESAQEAVFVEQKAYINTPAGHGEMAEEANNMIDRLHGLDAKVVGRDNAKNGADRQIGDIFIQTKYYNTARGSLEACFDSDTGKYRYMKDGKPMQLEVPKDQYVQVLEGFKEKIRRGNVPGVKDPNEANNIVRKGHLTYKQAVNLTKPGTIESLAYDALTGIVSCSFALGLTFVVTVFLTYRRTGDLKQSIQTGASAGLQVFGITFVQHMLVSQIARTQLAKLLIKPSEQIVKGIGFKTSQTIVNGIRTLSGKGAIYGAAATKHLAKLLRSNVLTSAVSFAVFSAPETYKLAMKKISGAQYAKNMGVLAGSIAAGTGGAVAAGVTAAKIGGVAGMAVAPGVGAAVGIAGGFVGGVVGTAAVKTIGDILHEDDIEAYGRLFNAYVSCMTGEYLLDEAEVDKLVKRLDDIKQKNFKKLFENIAKSEKQEEVLREFLVPHFDTITAERLRFVLPSDEEMASAIVELTDIGNIENENKPAT